MFEYLRTSYDKDYYEDKPCWFVCLSDMSMLYQDDFAFGNRAWNELGEHCQQNNLGIVAFGARNRDNIIWPLKDGLPDYFFVKAGLSFSGDNSFHNLFVMGYRDGEIIKTKTVKVPEMLVIEEDDRPYEGSENQCIAGVNLVKK